MTMIAKLIGSKLKKLVSARKSGKIIPNPILKTLISGMLKIVVSKVKIIPSEKYNIARKNFLIPDNSGYKALRFKTATRRIIDHVYFFMAAVLEKNNFFMAEN